MRVGATPYGDRFRLARRYEREKHLDTADHFVYNSADQNRLITGGNVETVLLVYGIGAVATLVLLCTCLIGLPDPTLDGHSLLGGGMVLLLLWPLLLPLFLLSICHDIGARRCKK